MRQVTKTQARNQMTRARTIIPIPNLLTTTIRLSSGRLARSNMLVPFPMVRLESAALGEGEELDVRLAAIKVTIEPSQLLSQL